MKKMIVLTHFLFAVVGDIVTKLGKVGMLNETLYDKSWYAK